MRKNLAVVALFVFLCISVFLNLAAFGERIRLNGTIDELNTLVIYDLEYANAADNAREQLAHYSWYTDQMLVASINGDKKLFDENRFYRMSAINAVNEATTSAKIAKDQRSDYIRNAKYSSRMSQ